MFRNKNNNIYTVFTIVLFFLIISPMWLSRGMFLDGLIYASISRNLSEGLGSFWDLHYTFYTDNHFMSHPPLVFWLQSFLFKIFGDTFYVEKIFSVVSYVISGFIIIKIWEIVTNRKGNRNFWMPLFLWVVIPLTTWSAVNNLLENTMMVFDLLAIMFIFKSLQKKSLLNVLFASFSIFLAFMSKGLPALFPFILYFFVWIIEKRISFKKMLVNSLLLVFFTLTFIVGVLAINENAFYFFETYFQKQILGTINMQTENKWYYIVVSLLEQLIIPLSILVLFIIIFKVKKIYKNLTVKKSLTILVIALSGVLPIMLSSKQRAFYLIPTLPLFAISFALFIDGFLRDFFDNLLKNKRFLVVFRIISLVFLLVALFLTINNFGKINRDKRLIDDIGIVASETGCDTNISISKEICSNWSMYAYFQRYYKISLTTSKDLDFKLISLKDISSYSDYTVVDIELYNFKLLKHKEP